MLFIIRTENSKQKFSLAPSLPVSFFGGGGRCVCYFPAYDHLRLFRIIGLFKYTICAVVFAFCTTNVSSFF